MPWRPASRGRAMPAEHRWPAMVALLLALTIFLTLPSDFAPALRYAVAGLGFLLLIPLFLLNPVRFQRETLWSRRLSIMQTLLLLVANQVALVQLVDQLVNTTSAHAPSLLLASLQVWVTNVIAFALVYWEIDRGGPVARSRAAVDGHVPPDFQFPMDSSSGAADWRPDFLDYLFSSVWTATAFSPTDAMPLTHRVKALMVLESVSSLLLFALVVGRSVNLFP